MAQFDLYVNTDKDTNKSYPYFVDIQNSLLEGLNSRVVIPLAPYQQPDKNYPKNLCPVIEVNNNKFVLLTHQLTSVSVNFLKRKETSLANHRDVLIAAIDFLVTGI